MKDATWQRNQLFLLFPPSVAIVRKRDATSWHRDVRADTRLPTYEELREVCSSKASAGPNKEFIVGIAGVPCLAIQAKMEDLHV